MAAAAAAPRRAAAAAPGEARQRPAGRQDPPLIRVRQRRRRLPGYGSAWRTSGGACGAPGSAPHPRQAAGRRSPADYALQKPKALAVAARCGQPDYFITVTCNPRWPEIQRCLRPGQTYQMRPDIVPDAPRHRTRCAQIYQTYQMRPDIVPDAPGHRQRRVPSQQGRLHGAPAHGHLLRGKSGLSDLRHREACAPHQRQAAQQEAPWARGLSSRGQGTHKDRWFLLTVLLPALLQSCAAGGCVAVLCCCPLCCSPVLLAALLQFECARSPRCWRLCYSSNALARRAARGLRVCLRVLHARRWACAATCHCRMMLPRQPTKFSNRG